MYNKNLYNKLLKEKKIANIYNIPENEIVIKKSNVVIKLLSFFILIISKVFKVIAYLLIIGLCSIGATWLANYIFKVEVF